MTKAAATSPHSHPIPVSWKTEGTRAQSQLRMRRDEKKEEEEREEELTIVGDSRNVDDREDGESADSTRPEEDLVVEEVELEESSFEMFALDWRGRAKT